MKNNMKYLGGLIFLVGMVWFQMAHAAGAVVQIASSSLVSTATTSVHFASPLTAGNTLIMCARFQGDNTFTQASTTQGEIYATISSSTTGNTSSDGKLVMLYVPNIIGGNSTTTIQMGSALSNLQMSVAEISGLSSSPLDKFSFQNSTNNGGSLATFGSGLTATTTQANEYLGYCGTSVGANGNPWAAVSPFTIRSNSGTVRLIYEDNNVTSTARYSASSTQNASNGWMGGLATFALPNPSISGPLVCSLYNVSMMGVTIY